MARWNRAGALAVLACGGLAAIGGDAVAQAPPAGTPPAWEVLVRCAQMGDKGDRLACYDEAMRAAGYAPKPEAVAEAKRRFFGLKAPQINLLKHKEETQAAATAAPPPAAAEAAAPARSKRGRARAEATARAPRENENQVVVTLAKIAVQGTGKLLMVTDEGQIWEQVGDQPVGTLPKEGASMLIHRGSFGGYFCDVTKYISVRCTRLR
jgi:hypothetical protein